MEYRLRQTMALHPRIRSTTVLCVRRDDAALAGCHALLLPTLAIPAPRLGAEEVVRRSLEIAADICIYTNSNIAFEELG